MGDCRDEQMGIFAGGQRSQNECCGVKLINSPSCGCETEQGERHVHYEGGDAGKGHLCVSLIQWITRSDPLDFQWRSKPGKLEWPRVARLSSQWRC